MAETIPLRLPRHPLLRSIYHRMVREMWVLRVGVLLASLFPLWAMMQNLDHRNDDAYITLTYAKSLAAGEGWRYNGGSVALGTTTPLFALVVAGLARLLPDMELAHLAVAWGVGCWIGTAWLLFLGHQTFGLTRWGGTLAALVVLWQGGWWMRALGMEGAFLIAGVMVAIWFTARGNALASGLVSALLFLIRPEGLAMVPLAGAWLLWHHRPTWKRTLLRFGAGAALILGCWSLYAVLTFGSLLPASASAKMAQGALWSGESFLEKLVREWLPPLAARYGPSALLSLLWPLVGVGVGATLRQRGPLLLLAAWVTLFLLGYGYLQAPAYWWYMLPLLFALWLFAGVGLAVLAHQPGRGWRWVGVALTLFFLGVTLQRGVESLQRGQGDVRAETYLATAAWLRENTPPGSTVAFVEIGYLGYYTDNRIVDLVGLIEPAFTANGARLDLASNFWQAQPDYLLYHPAFDWLLAAIVEDGRFRSQYRLAAQLPSHLGSPLHVYERVAPPPPAR